MASVNLSEYKPLNLVFANELKIAIVVAEWNSHITNNLHSACSEILLKEGVTNISTYKVPGAFELTFAAQRLSKQNFNAVIAIGCVIRGETPHFDYVCSAVAHGIKDCNILGNVPTIFCVLTDENETQSKERSGGNLGNKGVEAAITALKMIDFERNLKNEN